MVLEASLYREVRMTGTRIGLRISPEAKVERDQKINRLFGQGIAARALGERFGLSIATVLLIVKESRGKND